MLKIIGHKQGSSVDCSARLEPSNLVTLRVIVTVTAAENSIFDAVVGRAVHLISGLHQVEWTVLYFDPEHASSVTSKINLLTVDVSYSPEIGH